MKRIAAIVLCDLACELARSRRAHARKPLAVIVDDEEENGKLDAVDEVAWRYGARPGQSAAEAHAYVGHLQIVHLTRADVQGALASIAEIALAFAPTVALELARPQPEPLLRYPAGAGAAPLDTVWLDVTGCARMFGGEDLLLAELRARLSELGFRARMAIADGPRLAQALARWSAVETVAPQGSAEVLAELPVACLPLGCEVAAWLAKLGIWNVDELARLERTRVAHRLGRYASDVLELCSGRDDMPLCAYQPERRIVELASFEEPLTTSEPLMFVLRGMAARASARLGSRAEACAKASLELIHDRAALVLAQREGRAFAPERIVDLSLPVPIARQDDLLRTIQVKLERLEVSLPIASVRLVLEELTRRSEAQLDMMSLSHASPDALPTVLAELCAALGNDRVGVLRVVDSHRPEARSELVPVPLSHRPLVMNLVRSNSLQAWLHEPTRILPAPVGIGKVRPGSLIGADRHMYLIDHLRMSARLEGIEWWRLHPVSRDYARVHVHSGLSNGPRHALDHAEAWIFIDRSTHRAYLHGWFD
jgi:protein ImuB